MPLDKLYMDKAIDKGQDTFRQGNADSVKILTFVAILLLVIGVFNFIHISSVVIIKRGRELGMKKVFGARPMQLFIQLYAENWVLTAIALFIGWVFIEITQPIPGKPVGHYRHSRCNFQSIINTWAADRTAITHYTIPVFQL